MEFFGAIIIIWIIFMIFLFKNKLFKFNQLLIPEDESFSIEVLEPEIEALEPQDGLMKPRRPTLTYVKY